VYVMQAMRMKDGSYTLSLLFAVLLLIICAFIVARLKDPDVSHVSTEMTK